MKEIFKFTFIASLVLSVASAAKAFVVFAPVILILQALGLGGVAIYDSSRPPLTQQQEFVKYMEPQLIRIVTDAYSRHDLASVQNGFSETVGSLRSFRSQLRTRLTADRAMSAAAFDAAYGTDSAPNYCAVAQAALTAHFVSEANGFLIRSPSDADWAQAESRRALYGTCGF